MTSLRNVLLFIVVIFTLSFTISTEVTKSFSKSNISNGDLLPEISFKNDKDEIVDVRDFKGKYVYINLWTTWSQPSINELPYLQELITTYGKKVVFVNLSVDYQRDIEKWKAYIKDNKLIGNQLITDNDWNTTIIKILDVVKIPRAILIDKNGKIIDSSAPKPSSKELKQIFKNLN